MDGDGRRRDGIGTLVIASLALVAAGVLALVLSATGKFLPYEFSSLGLTPADLCAVADCRVNGFMAHDRAALGGALVGLGLQYSYLVLGPLRRGQAWAWWLLAVSASLGVLSFLAFIGYGYLDPWHATATGALAALFAVGLARARRQLGPAGHPGLGRLPDLGTWTGRGRAVLLAGAAGVAVAGLEILRIGTTKVFVNEDLSFMGVGAHHLHALDPALVPLIAHDRATFGAAVLVTGLTTFVNVWYARLTPAMWRTILVAGTISLAAAIGTHLAVGYLDAWHLAPPTLGALSLIVGLALCYPRSFRRAAPAACASA